MKTLVLVAVILLIPVVLLCYASRDTKEYVWLLPEKLPSSEYEWDGELGEEYLQFMCINNNIDYNEPFRIECPKCEIGAFAEFPERPTWNGGILFGFYCIGREDPDKCSAWCKYCYYPLGTDWKVMQLEPKAIIDLSKIEDCNKS